MQTYEQCISYLAVAFRVECEVDSRDLQRTTRVLHSTVKGEEEKPSIDDANGPQIDSF